MSDAEASRPCPSCPGVMRRGEREETLTYGGEAITYLQPGWHCDRCDDGILQDADNEVHDAALHELMARVRKSPISPLMVRAARTAVGLSQREAGSVFGGGPTAFYKYETARSFPSESMANLLRLALKHPDLFAKQVKRAPEQPTLDDLQLIRRTVRDDRLNTIINHIYDPA